MIHLDGTPRVFFQTESFTNNGDNSKEALSVYGSGVLSAATGEMTIAGALSSQSSYSSTTLGQALITIKRSVQISFQKMAFTNNWKIETDYGNRA